MKFQLATKHGPEEVECFPASDPNVVVHQTSYDGEGNELGLFGISHVPSGLAFLNGMPNKEIAAIMAEWFVAQGLNLSGDKATIQASASPEFRTKMRMIQACKTAYIDALNDLLNEFDINGVTG